MREWQGPFIEQQAAGVRRNVSVFFPGSGRLALKRRAYRYKRSTARVAQSVPVVNAGSTNELQRLR